jgi:hypothetical protein
MTVTATEPHHLRMHCGEPTKISIYFKRSQSKMSSASHLWLKYVVERWRSGTIQVAAVANFPAWGACVNRLRSQLSHLTPDILSPNNQFPALTWQGVNSLVRRNLPLKRPKFYPSRATTYLPEFIRKKNKLQEEVELNTGSEKKGCVTRARWKGRGKMKRKWTGTRQMKREWWICSM